jgi:hypothetical protein
LQDLLETVKHFGFIFICAGGIKKKRERGRDKKQKVMSVLCTAGNPQESGGE